MKIWTKLTIIGTLSAGLLMGIYFLIVTLVSGWNFALEQFAQYWYFLIALSAGFGVQVGLFVYLKHLVKTMKMGGAVAVTGTTSTLSMISCCAHYLANIVPVLGVAGALSVIAQYQTEIFWAGIAFNLFGIAFISGRIIKFKKSHEN